MRTVNLKRKDGGTDEYLAYDVDSFPFEKLDRKKMGTKHKKQDVKSYCCEFGTFDIETSTIDGSYTLDRHGIKVYDTAPYGFMYHWQMCIGGYLVYGRDWESFGDMIRKLADYFALKKDSRFVIYVHNLSYEHQFMRLFLKEYAGGYAVFAPRERKPFSVKCNNGIEFRCSYALSNMSLNKATGKELGVVHVKADGDLDYRKLRTPSTYLDDTEFGYCMSDVLSLYEYIKCKMSNDYDNLETIPMTSTGYVRRKCRNATRKNRKYRESVFLKTQMSVEVYTMLNETARGGNTHTNRYMSGRIYHEADSYDVQSSYPAQMLLQLYPIDKFTPYGRIESDAEFKKLLDTRACLFHCTFVDIHLKPDVAMPYIPTAKLLTRSGKCVYDNGRVLSCDGFIQLTLTDVDFKIIAKQYEWDRIYISEMYTAHYGPLPQELRDVVKDYFSQKCILKYDRDHEQDTAKREELEYFYGKKKNELNSIFGMAYTNPVRGKVKETDLGTWEEEPADIAKALEQYYRSRNNFLFYAWGVWITAHARAWLQTLLDTCEETATVPHASIYCDTDSCKGIGINHAAIAELNKQIEELCIRKDAYCDYKGIRYYLGVYERETAEPYKEFISLGAKKYAYTDASGLHITVSGVQKKAGAAELGDIRNFKLGFIFRKAGGQTLYYNDDPQIHTIVVNGEEIVTGSNIGMVDSTYTLGITSEYAALIGYNY